MPRIQLVAVLLVLPSLSVAQTVDTSRTAWVTPDLSGYWEYRSTTPLQRPVSLASKAVLTPEEMVDYLVERHAAIGRERDLQLNADWWQPGGLTDGRTSLVVDPPNGRIPQSSAGARGRRARLGPAIRLRLADGPEDRERYERCIMGRTVPLLAVAPNRLAQVFQTRDFLVILHEQNSDLRIIPLIKHDRLATPIRQWTGSSRGFWEGDTLVVETMNFNGQWTLEGASRNMRVVERFRMAEVDTLSYQFTIDDPESFAGPWTVSFPITRARGPLFENACHEGNHSMPLILLGARAEERAGVVATP